MKPLLKKYREKKIKSSKDYPTFATTKQKLPHKIYTAFSSLGQEK